MRNFTHFLLLLFGMLWGSHSSYAQSPFTIGLKSGLAYTGIDDGTLNDSSIDPSVALGGGYAVAEGRFNFQADIFYEPRFTSLFGVQPAQRFNNITIPVYVRTGAPDKLVHISLGAFWSKALSEPNMGPSAFGWTFRNQEWGGTAGIDVHLYDDGTFEATLGLSARVGFSPVFQATTVPNEKAVGDSRWYGLTLNTYFHPEKKKRR